MSIIGDRANEINLGSCLTTNHITDFYYDYYDIESIQLDAGYQRNKSMIGDELKGEWYRDPISASNDKGDGDKNGWQFIEASGGLGVDIAIIISIIIIIIMLTVLIVQKHFHWLIILIFFAVCNGNHIICDEKAECDTAKLVCNEGEDCTISCFARYACYDADIICPSGAYNCSLECNGYMSCMYVEINKGNTIDGGNLFINGMNGSSHLEEGYIHCPINGDCNIACSSIATSEYGCYYMFIYGEQAKSVHVDAGYGGEHILLISRIHCPETGGECTITVHNSGEKNQMNGMEIWAPESFNQLSIVCEDDPANCYQLGSEPKLYCTLQYNHSCDLEMVSASYWQCMNGADDFCNDYSLPTTPAPTTEISQCFIGSRCKDTEECCPDDIDEKEHGIICKKNINKKKEKKYCCIKKGFSGCSIDMDCCISNNGKKRRCLDGVCVKNKNMIDSVDDDDDDDSDDDDSDDDDSVEEDNVLINDEQKSDLSLNKLNDNNANVKWFFFGVLSVFVILILSISCYLCMINIFKKLRSKQINTEEKSCDDNKDDNDKKNTM